MADLSERIKEFNKDRVGKYTLIKYRMMTESAFRFFRGTCHLFYEDLFNYHPLPFSPSAWICGDLHLENYGSFKADNRLEYFDLNDFDEALLAPAAWELVRMITSIFTGFDSLKIKREDSFKMAHLFLQTYAVSLAKGKALYIEQPIAKGIVRTFLDRVASRKQKELLAQRTCKIKGKLRLRIDNRRCFKLNKTRRKKLIDHLTGWMRENKNHHYPYRILDAAYRIAGTGSIGQKRYVFLVQNLLDPSKYGLLDMKQSKLSCLHPYLNIRQPSWNSEAERIISVQFRMQNVSPAFLSTIDFKEDSYVLKELQPTDDKIDFGVIKSRFKDVSRVIRDMAILTASAQLRSSGRQGSAAADELISFGEDNSWHQILFDYAANYANQVKKDYQTYMKDYKEGYFSK
jgi:uncharacterized protein (DUF2252 family)